MGYEKNYELSRDSNKISKSLKKKVQKMGLGSFNSQYILQNYAQ